MAAVLSAFLDSSAIYPLANQNDCLHQEVARSYRAVRRFLTHEGILLESLSLLTKRLGKGAALDVIGRVRASPRIEIVSLAPPIVEAGWLRCVRHDDKEWDWIDCISFELMEQRRIRVALSLDHHFEQAGFTLLPALRDGKVRR